MLGVVEPIFAQYPTSPPLTSAFASARVPSGPTAHSCKSSEALVCTAFVAPSTARQGLSSVLPFSKIQVAKQRGCPAVARLHLTYASGRSYSACPMPASINLCTFARSSSKGRSLSRC